MSSRQSILPPGQYTLSSGSDVIATIQVPQSDVVDGIWKLDPTKTHLLREAGTIQLSVGIVIVDGANGCTKTLVAENTGWNGAPSAYPGANVFAGAGEARRALEFVFDGADLLTGVFWYSESDAFAVDDAVAGMFQRVSTSAAPPPRPPKRVAITSLGPELIPFNCQLDSGYYKLFGGANQDELIVFIDVPESGAETWYVYSAKLGYLTGNEYALTLSHDDSYTYDENASFSQTTPVAVTWGDTPTPPNCTYPSGSQPFSGSGKALVFKVVSGKISTIHWYNSTAAFTLANQSSLSLEPTSAEATAPAKRATSTVT
jgi:hypothetical protein